MNLLKVEIGFTAVPGLDPVWVPVALAPDSKSVIVELTLAKALDLALVYRYDVKIPMRIEVVHVNFDDEPAECSGYPLLERYEHEAAASHYAVVFINGWLKDVVDCAPSYAGSFAEALSSGKMPASAYFGPLLPWVSNALGQEAAIYTYTYPTYQGVSPRAS